MKLTVPSAQALTTSLAQGTREALETLAIALAQQIEATVDADERLKAVRAFVATVTRLDQFDRADRREARLEANRDALTRYNEGRLDLLAQRLKLKAEPPADPAPSFIDELARKRDSRSA